MNRFYFTWALLISLPVLAEGNVSIKPGASVEVGGTTIQCEGYPNDDLPKCRVETEANWYAVWIGDNKFEYAQSLGYAIIEIEKLRKAGLCR